MTSFFDLLGRVTLAAAPPGVDALWLSRQARERTILHVALDETSMARLAGAVRVMAPKLEVFTFPAWDCLPYDRVSPHRDVVAARIDTLTRLAESPEAPRLVVTTVSALLQRVPAPESFQGRAITAKPGDRIAVETLTAFLTDNGYERVDTVKEPGEYALRGGILDLYPTGEEEPLRLDFFGDELDTIRAFDPLTQLTSRKETQLILRPVSELHLDQESIERFRKGYRAAFGTSRGDDPLYEAISEGRPYPGMEHWLPLFHGGLVKLSDYLPGAALTFDYQSDEAAKSRWETIDDFYEARRQIHKADGGEVYKPLPPEALYLREEELQALTDERTSGFFTPFAAPQEAGQTLDLGGRQIADFAEARAKPEEKALYQAVKAFTDREHKVGRRVILTAFSDGARDRLAHLLQEGGAGVVRPVPSWAEAKALHSDILPALTLPAESGFSFDGVTVITEQDILGERIARGSAKKRRAENYLREISALTEGDYVVHIDHGIGQYKGLQTLEIGEAAHDCLRVDYHGGDKLFVPVENLEVLSRYGGEDSEVELDRLGNASWQARKARVKERLKEMAGQLIKIAAQRELNQVDPFEKPDGLYEEFCARFPYPETDDQLRSIEETLADLTKGRPMDRLVCGDVGFGKTEVALRAAFLAVMSGHQVAVVVPTTLLARQHFKTFSDRFSGLPVRVRQLSRLVSAREAKETKEALAEGQVDIIVGTHALMSKSIAFRDLGLLIIDEEQHFGVKQKERLKELRADVHVLTLTATPIPRTLQLAMSGVKEMSLIATPPVDRLAVRTFVLPYDPVVVREAILREHYRGGQTFYVCPRLEDLPELEQKLKELVPEVKVGVAHGQLPAAELEEVMGNFVDHRFDVLLSTNIVESGLDIPAANTMIIHRADMFGLAQLYQLRGRIGRSKQRGYAYLTLRPGKILTKSAQKRLEVMQTLDTLGAGFTLASHDMDIRGAGNLLGEEQSGHVREVGIELYQQMLEEAVALARSGEGAELPAEEGWTPQINLGSAVLIPEAYVPDLSVRLGLYRRLSSLVNRQEIDAFAAELIDRFGALPPEVENLLQIIAIKQLCKMAGVEKVDAGPKGAVVAFRGDSFANPGGLVGFIQKQAGNVSLRPDHKLVYKRNWDSAEERVTGVKRLLEGLAKLVEEKAAA